MSENGTETSDDDDFSGAQLDFDIYLHLFASQAIESAEFEMTITLQVSGSTISGMIINPKRWREMFATVGKQSGSDLFETIAEGLPAEVADADNFLHLSSARIIGGAFPIPKAGMLWRGRISDVNAWSPGSLS